MVCSFAFFRANTSSPSSPFPSITSHYIRHGPQNPPGNTNAQGWLQGTARLRMCPCIYMSISHGQQPHGTTRASLIFSDILISLTSSGENVINSNDSCANPSLFSRFFFLRHKSTFKVSMKPSSATLQLSTTCLRLRVPLSVPMVNAPKLMNCKYFDLRTEGKTRALLVTRHRLQT